MIKVGYVQTSPLFGDKEKNFAQIENLLLDVKVDLIVLPELFATGYTFVSKDEAVSLAETPKGKTSNFLLKLSKLTGAVIIGGYVEKVGNEIFNSAMIVSNNSVIDSYRKIHLYYKENLWFSPGNKPLKVYEINDIKIGIMICFDWIFCFKSTISISICLKRILSSSFSTSMAESLSFSFSSVISPSQYF